MKKLLGSVLALAFVMVTSQANAELLKNFKYSGSAEVDAVAARNVMDFNKHSSPEGTPNDRIGTAQTRITVNMDWDLLDDVHSKVTLGKNDRVYGAAGAKANGSDDINTIQNNVVMDQAYFKIDKVFGAVDTTFGRMFYGDPGDLIVYYGPKYEQYGMNVTAIDGARFDWSGEKAYATIVMFEPNANGTALGADTGAPVKKDIRGLIVGNKGMENLDGKVYLWNQEQHLGLSAAANGQNDNLYVLGLKLKGKYGGAYGSVEFAQNFGDNRANGFDSRYAGDALLIDVGMKADVEKIGAFTPWAQFGRGSGNGNVATARTNNMDFQPIASDYRPGAIYGRFDSLANNNAALGYTTAGNSNVLAANGLTNRIIWGLGVKATPSALNKLTAGIAYYDFNLQKLDDGQTAYVAGAGGNRHIGSELDLTGEWKHSDNVSFKGTIGDFQPGGLIKNANTTGTSPALMAALDVAVKF